MQLIRDISKNNEQYIQKTTLRGSASKLHEQLCYTSQNEERTRGKNDLILKDSKET